MVDQQASLPCASPQFVGVICPSGGAVVDEPGGMSDWEKGRLGGAQQSGRAKAAF